MNERIFFFYGESGAYGVWTIDGIVTEVGKEGPQEYVGQKLESIKSIILPDYKAKKLFIAELKP